MAGEVVAEAEVVVAVLASEAEEEAVGVAVVLAAVVVVWVPESVSTLDRHKAMRRSLGR